MENYIYKSFDGKEIYVREWKEVKNPKGIIQIVHGMVEHGGRYDGFARAMNECGYIVFADDHRAHGQTDLNTLGYSKGDIFADTLRDLEGLACEYSNKYHLPVFVFGHSYGSFLTQRYIEECGNLLGGAVIGGSGYMNNLLTRTAFVISSAACLVGLAKKPSNLIKKATFDAYDKKFNGSSFLSSLPETWEAYSKDKLCGFVCSNNFYKSFFKGILGAYKKKNVKKLSKNLRVLLISGKEDPVGEMGKSVDKLEKFYEKNCVNVSKILYDGVRHEYLNDISQAASYKAIADFFDSCL